MEEGREKAHVSVWSAAADPTCLASFNLSVDVSAYATYNVDPELAECRFRIVTDFKEPEEVGLGNSAPFICVRYFSSSFFFSTSIIYACKCPSDER